MSAPSWAVPGREVVCKADGWNVDALISLGVQPPDRVPMLNEVLRIRDAILVKMPGYEPAFCLAFEGLPPFYYPVDFFRPVITIEDDMAAHFNALLDVRVEA